MLTASPSGQVGKPTFVAPATGCFQRLEVQKCIADVWLKLCFEPSEQGIASREFLITTRPSPVPVFRKEPVYPPRAAHASINGKVFLRFDVDPKGLVQSIKIVESTPAGVFDEASREAVSKWRYEPAVDAKGRAVWMRGLIVRLRFGMHWFWLS